MKVNIVLIKREIKYNIDNMYMLILLFTETTNSRKLIIEQIRIFFNVTEFLYKVTLISLCLIA